MNALSDFKDKKASLIFFGILELLMGSLSFLFFILVLFSLAYMAKTSIDVNQQMTISSVVISSLLYLVAAIIFIVLGIGSIQAKRWAQSLSLLLSWFTLIVGVASMFFLTILFPDFFDQMQMNAQSDPNTIMIVKVIMFTFLILFLIVLPGIFVLFYQGNNVRKTVQKYDTKERWTDKCPLPLIALSFIFLYTSIAPLFALSYGFVAPFFGTFLVGWPAAVLWIANSIVCIYLAIHVYKMNIRAWLYSLCFYLFWLVSFFVTLLTNDIFDMYRYMNFQPEQLEMMKNIGISNSHMTKLMIFFFVPFLFFLLYIKKFFKAETSKKIQSGSV